VVGVLNLLRVAEEVFVMRKMCLHKFKHYYQKLNNNVLKLVALIKVALTFWKK
jgi:hypothetical protein